MVRFQKLLKIHFSFYTGTTCTVSSGNCPKVLLYYLQFSSHAYCGAAGPVFKMAWQKEKAFCVLCFEVSRSVITAQRKFRARFIEDAPHKNSVFFKPCTKLTLHCNHRSAYLKTEHTESLLLLRRHLGNWPRNEHEKRTAGSA
jgi:hypothetical protein